MNQEDITFDTDLFLKIKVGWEERSRKKVPGARDTSKETVRKEVKGISKQFKCEIYKLKPSWHYITALESI